MSKRMKNKVVLVSGSGSIGPGWGNGKACSVLYAREGAKIIACDIDLSAAEETVNIIKEEGGEATALQCDVSKAESVSKLFENILKVHEKIDVLHSNVGIVEVGGPEDISEENWDKLIDTNLKSAFSVVRASGDSLENCSVVLMSTAAVGIGLANHELIVSAKAGVESLARSAAKTYARKNLRFNTISPGMVQTPLTKNILKNDGNSSEVDMRLFTVDY